MGRFAEAAGDRHGMILSGVLSPVLFSRCCASKDKNSTEPLLFIVAMFGLENSQD